MDKFTSRKDWDEVLNYLVGLNPKIQSSGDETFLRPHRLQKVLVANRGEIAKRFFLALHEEGIPSVAIVTDADIGQSWYDFATEVVMIGDPMNYTNMPIVVAAAYLTMANAIYPGYGFLSEKADFVELITTASEVFDHEIIFMGPKAEVMHSLGDKIKARTLAKDHNIPLLPGSEKISGTDEAKKIAAKIGYPIVVKLSAAGGGRGIILVESEDALVPAIESCQRIGISHYNDDTFFIEKFITEPVHMEVQIFNGWAVGVRKCAVQRNNQKIIEESGHTFIDDSTFLAMLAEAEKIARVSGYINGCGAGTVEFLMDSKTGMFGFLEVNTRLQVEYAVTELSLNIDLVKWQILNFDGRMGEIQYNQMLKNRFLDKQHTIECRINAEEPENNYRPSPGRLHELILPTFHGIRCDFGFSGGDVVPPLYDAMIGKVIAIGANREECIIRLERALQELYVKGFHTNIKQLINILRHPKFIQGDYTNRLLVDYPELQMQSPAAESSESDEKYDRTVLIFGALAEYTRLYYKKSKEFLVRGSIETSVRNRAMTSVPFKYFVKFFEEVYTVEVYQVNLNAFHLFLDGRYVGRVDLTSYTERNDDYLFRYGTKSYRVRVDRRAKHLSIRMKDRNNKVGYYRLQIEPEGIEENKDPVGMVRSPFQCTFVSMKGESATGKDLKIGSRVRKDDPVIVVSSMKMETVIYAPCDGVIEYLIEDGDAEKLILSRTADGKILGKGLEEGEVLVIVKPDTDEGREKLKGRDLSADAAQDSKEYNIRNILDIENIKKLFIAEPKQYMAIMLEIVRATIQGYVQQDSIVDEIKRVLSKILEQEIEDYVNESVEEGLDSIINSYIGIKRLISTLIVEGTSYLDELNYLIANINNPAYKPPKGFKDVIDSVLESYGLDKFKPSSGSEVDNMHRVLMHIQRSYYICSENKELIINLIKIAARSKKPLKSTSVTLANLVKQEQYELDDSVSRETRKLIDLKFREYAADPTLKSAISDAGEFDAVFLAEITVDIEKLKKLLTDSLKKPSADLVPSGLPAWVSKALSEKTGILKKKYDLSRLYSPIKDAVVYSASEKDTGKKSYFSFDYIKNDSVTAENISVLLNRGLRMIGLYNRIEARDGNRIELLDCEIKHTSDEITNSISEEIYSEIRRGFMLSSDVFVSTSTAAGLIHLWCGAEKNGPIFSFDRVSGEFFFDILLDGDARNPYASEITASNQKLFSIRKWPMDVWASWCFDGGKFDEVLIPTIDDVKIKNAEGKTEDYKVAAKIYYGKIFGKEACFYVKDYRIRGGATGDIEGLKYIAAAYFAYINGCPLYVWNDGAGANINEGMISLNRGGQGFMMNSLLSGKVDMDMFYNYMMKHPDEKIPALVKIIDEKFGRKDRSWVKNSSFVTAIGVGSSAGLDVYGSSQAAIQIILDSDQSYRVLTGSNVIRSVMGEDISNYDIGGAKVMGSWTGIADFVAPDKFSLIAIIRKLHRMFSFEKQSVSIERKAGINAELSESSHGLIVFTEEMVRANADKGLFISFKENYYGSRSLIGGFATLAGRRVLIMGPRNNIGIRSFASVTKAKELCKVADRTSSHQILVFGKRWYQNADIYDQSGIRARMDLINTLRDAKGLKIMIISDIEGFLNVSFTSLADAMIFVKKEGMSQKEIDLASKTATFMVDSMAEAFDVSARIISMIDPVSEISVKEPKKKPEIPAETGTPYDMMASVIERSFDESSFVEFFREMNNPVTGPNLITGLATVNGRSVGVIADQPQMMGGGADAPGTEKFRVFVQFLNRHRIPLIMLSNSSGFVPGVKQERLRIQAIGAESLDENILGRIPVLSVVLRHNYGGRQIQAFNRHIRPGIVCIALRDAVMAVLGAEVGFDLLRAKKYKEMLDAGKKDEAAEFRKQYISEYLNKARAENDAMNVGSLDWLIDDVSELRKHLIRGLDEACRKNKEAFEE